ncbi:MAG: hypothetical protein ACOCTM_02930 [Bacteroidota bacterium]
MKTNSVDLSAYKKKHSFYPEIRLLITIKSFNLQAIRERYLKSRNKKSKRTGSVNRRETAIGGLAEITLKKGEISHQKIVAKLPEPRGIDSQEDITAFSSENKVHVLYKDHLKTLTNPWFSYIHTVDIDRKEKQKILISSSGFDCIFEYSIISQQKTHEWFAWENGFDHGIDPENGEKLYLTRNKETAAEYEREGKHYILIDDPVNQVLPTAKRAAFIKSVVYDPLDRENIIATFFHEGAVYQIKRNSGKTEKILDGLVNPHGGMKLKSGSIMGTSTKGGEVVIREKEIQYHYDFSRIPGKPDFLSDFEWIQNSIVTREGNILAIDSNRNSFVIFNPEKKLIDFIPYDENWAVQDVIETSADDNQLNILKNAQW